MKVFWFFRRKMQRSKEEKQRWRSRLLPQNRPVRVTCPALTGPAVFLSFFLSFQTQGFFPFYKPRCPVCKDQKDCIDINITLMATLYHTTCSGLIDEYTHVHGRAKPSKAILSSQSFRPWTQTQNSAVHMHRKEQGFWKQKLTHFATHQDRCCSQGVRGSQEYLYFDMRCLFSDPSRMASLYLPQERRGQSLRTKPTACLLLTRALVNQTQEHLIQPLLPPRDVGRAAAEGTAQGSSRVLCHSRGTYIISTLPASHMPNGWLNTAS